MGRAHAIRPLGGAEPSWPVRVDQFLEDGARPSRHRPLGPERARCCTPTATGWTSPSRTGASSACAGAPSIASITAALDPKDLFGWQANNSPDRLTRPLVRERGELVETDWDTAMGRIVERSQELRADPGGWGRFGFYTSGQLFLEEYYTLAVIGKAGIGTPHMDGNTRLCTATAAAALKASFGTDGQPGSYRDVDHCDAIALWGHNVAETQAVLWMRMLDRRRGADPPRMLAVDPRPTPVAREADIHLAIRNGTNLALMNAPPARDHRARLVRRGVRRRPHHRLRGARAVVAGYTSKRVAEICGIPAAQDSTRPRSSSAPRERLLSTVLQGFYQSQPGHGRGVPGQQPASAAGHDRAARRRASTR